MRNNRFYTTSADQLQNQAAWEAGNFGSAPVIITIFLAFNKLSDRVSKIEGKIEIIVKNGNFSLTQSAITLKEGEKVLIESGSKKYLEQEKAQLMNALSEKVGGDFSSPFDVQEKAKEVVRDAMSKTGEMSSIKQYLYENSRKAEDIVTVMGLALRDTALQEKGMKKKEEMAAVREK